MNWAIIGTKVLVGGLSLFVAFALMFCLLWALGFKKKPCGCGGANNRPELQADEMNIVNEFGW